MRAIWVYLFSLTVMLSAVGCADLQQSTAPSLVDEVITGSSREGSSHYLWGYWEIRFDLEREEVEAIPLRTSQMHVNVVKFLEGPIMYISFKNLVVDGDEINLDVSLRHPFPGYNQYTGFDVRGIFITPGTVGGYEDAGILHADKSGSYLLNADGWTRWWNPSEFPIGNNIFSYMNGKLGVPYNGSNLNATLNAYKYFCDDLDADDPLDELVPSHRGMFQHGWTNTRHYRIHFDHTKPLIYNYAVDASWDVPSPNPPIAVPGDFPPTANAAEAYRVVPEIVENDLFFVDSVNKGGHAVVKVHVYDWWGCEHTVVGLDAPGVWTLETSTPVEGTSVSSTYQFELDGNALTSGGPVEALITATSTDDVYPMGDLQGEFVATYTFLSVPVSSVAKSPTVVSIEPNHYFINEVVKDAEVTGTNFASDAQVTLIKYDNPAIVIEAESEVVEGGSLIVCDIPLTDPSVEPGKYNVRVTNPGTGLYGELIKGFTVDQAKHPWPGWMAGGLNQAASEYVGYGDAGSPTAPQWTLSLPGYGGPSAGCAIANDGTIYVCTTNCALHAINPDGTKKWTFQPMTPWISYCPAIDLEGYVYVTIGSPSASYLYKVNPSTGTAVWSCYLGSAPCYPNAPAIGHDGAIYVYIGSISQSAKLIRVNPDGTLGWSVNLGAFAYSYWWQLGTAVLPDGDIICSGGSTGKIFKFHPDGTLVWEYQYTSWTLETPVVGPEGNVYFTTWGGGALVALHSDGTFYWSYDTGYYLWANPAVDPKTGRIFLGDRMGKFRCFSSSGAVLWTRDFGASRIDGTAAVDANGDVYVAVGNQPSQPYKGLVKMDGDTGDIIWQSDDLGYMLTSAPSIAADGSVYLPGYDNSHVLFKWGS